MADDIRHTERGPVRLQRLTIPRWVKLLVLVDVVVLAAAITTFALMHRSDQRANIANVGLRGSKPPDGQVRPDLSKVDGIIPAMPSAQSLRGHTVFLVSTCMDCPSGEIIGGALRRLAARDLPSGTRVEVVAWQGDVAKWRSDWHIPSSVPIHVVTGAASIFDVKRTLGIGDNGFGYLYDPKGTWRASYAVQLLQPDDIVHDMGVVAHD
jgi:hypothetical protein